MQPFELPEFFPDASGPELELLTDWYVWAFILDGDVRALYKGTGDRPGARKYLDELAAFMPADLAAGHPAPANPVQRSLADLWSRTAPSMFTAGRNRLAEATRALLRRHLPSGRSGTSGAIRPAFHMPYASRCNSHVDATRAHATVWARSMGMLDGLVWTQARFEAMDFALFAALTHPDVPASRLELVNDWHVWAWFVDDLFAATFEPTRDLAGAKAFVARLPAFLPADPVAMPDPANPAELGLADLWIRTAPRLRGELRLRLPGQIVEFAGHRLWEIANIVGNRAPDPAEYLATRRRITGCAPTLIRYAFGERVPREVLDTAPMRALVDTFRDIGPPRQDVFSYRSEIGHAGGINNGVLAVHRFLRCGLDEAGHVVNELITARLGRFEHIVSTELPALFNELRLDAGDRQRLLGYVEALQDWLAGDLQWSQVTGRYRTVPTVPHPPSAHRVPV